MKKLFLFIFTLIVVVGALFITFRTPSQQILVIGIDGATWDIARPMIDRGELPNLKKLMDTGFSGNLTSIDQPVVPAAWASFATGEESGSSGIFDFLTPIADSYDFRIISAGDLKSKPLWELASESGKRVGLVNFLFYPAPVINGFSIAGELTPADSLAELPDAVYPKSLGQEISSVSGAYQIDIKKFEEPSAFLSSIQTVLTQRTKALNYLLTTQEWDVAFALFNETNRIQHFFWKYQDPNNPEYRPNNPYEHAIEDHYRQLDASIGTLITAAGPKATVLVFSDHGFGPLYKTVSVNRWLEQENLITLNTSGASYAEKVDWRKTRAFFPSQFQGIFINVEGRYPNGVVASSEYDALRESIIKRILLLKDPETGTLIVTKAQKREDAYPGAHNGALPDIILTFAPGYHASNDTQGSIVRPSTYWSGIHNRDGMYILSQPGASSKTRDANLLDLAPTILRALDISIPNTMRGTPIDD